MMAASVSDHLRCSVADLKCSVADVLPWRKKMWPYLQHVCMCSMHDVQRVRERERGRRAKRGSETGGGRDKI